MSAISLKSITGITSITTPAGVDNQLTLHNNNTSEAVKLDAAGNLHFHNHLNITGITTASNFKTGTSNLHNTGLNVQDLDVDGHTNLDNVSIAGFTTITGNGTNGQLNVERASGAGLHIQAQSALGVFGTTSNHNLRFISNGNERMLLSTNGNVGINESSPSQRLHVGGDVQIGFNTPNDAGRQINFNVNRSSAGDTLANINWQWNNKYVAQIRGMAGYDTTNKDDAHLIFYTSSANNLSARLRIHPDGGITIGSIAATTSKAGILHTRVSTTTNPVVFENDTENCDVVIKTTGTNKHSILGFGDGANNLIGNIDYDHQNNSMVFDTNGGERLNISSAGVVTQVETGTGNGMGGIKASTASAGGNAGFGFITGGTQRFALVTIGSGGSEALRFYDNNNSAERLRITSDGNLVMNGASPNHDASSGSIFIKAPSGNPNRGIKWSDTSDTHYVKYESSVIDGLTINGYSGIAFATGSRTNSTWTERLRLTITGLLHGASDAEGNTTLGGNAGDSFSGTSAIQNTLIGKNAGTAITSGDQHTALGYNALKALTGNGGCTAIGAYALEDCTAGGNTAVGYNVLKETVSGQNNTAMGQDAAVNNVGNLNIAIGRDAMKASNNAAGHDNVVIGSYTASQALHMYRNVIIGRSAIDQSTSNNSIHNNVIIGYEAGRRLNYYIGHNVILGAHAMDGGGAGGGLANQYNISDNVAIGRYALQNAKATTNNCIVIGQEAAQNAATGSGTYSYWAHNIAIGYRCMRDATGGPDAMVAVGQNALEYHTGDGDGSSGGYTVAFGGGAFRNNRHVRHSVAVGNNAGTDWNPAKGAMHEGGCTFIGGGAGRQHSTGTSNIAVGRDSLNNVVTGTHNVAVGNRCFERITSGSHNCAVTGLYGALFVSTGDYNNFFGSLAGYAYDQTNATATGDHNNIFGGYSKSSGNNNDHENVFGGGLTGKGANTTFIKGAVYNSNNSSSFSTTSDERIKKNIVDNNTGLDAIEKIRVRNFEYRTKNEITDFDNPEAVVVKDKSGVQVGVIAQEIKDILPDVVKQNTTGAYTVDPDNLTWYLVNAVKELSAEVKSLKAQINS